MIIGEESEMIEILKNKKLSENRNFVKWNTQYSLFYDVTTQCHER